MTKRSIRTLHVIAGVDPKSGGPARSVPCLCRALADEGVVAWLLSNCVAADEAVDLRAGRLVAGAGGGFFSAFRDVSRVAEEFVPDVVHVHALWAPSNHAAVRYAVNAGIPVILSTRGMLDPWALSQKPRKKKLAMWLYQRRDLLAAACFHATAEQEERNIRAQGLRQPIVVIPNGVDRPAAMPVRRSRSEGKKIALFLSRLHPGKGLMDLVAAWAQLRPEGWLMRIVGPDVCGHRAEVENEIARLGLQSCFEFAGELDDAAKWQAYVDADLFVHPSHSENFGISIAEALAAGLPVITTKGAPWSELLGNSDSSLVHYCDSALVGKEGAARLSTNERTNSRTNELARPGRAGWWIDVGAEPLADALKEAVSLTDKERRAMGNNGQGLIEKKYSWRVIAGEMIQAYAWLLSGGERPACVHFES